jgi:hypothetical protein
MRLKLSTIYSVDQSLEQTYAAEIEAFENENKISYVLKLIIAGVTYAQI